MVEYLPEDKFSIDKIIQQTTITVLTTFTIPTINTVGTLNYTNMLKDGNTNMSRQKKVIDQKMFETLCTIQCTEEEVCSVLDVNKDTLIAWCKKTYNGKTFQKVFGEKRVGGKASLRRKLWEGAMTGNTATLIFALKNYLGMRDNPEPDDDKNDTDSVTINYNYYGGDNGRDSGDVQSSVPDGK